MRTLASTMKTTIGVILGVLVLAACGGDPMVACEEAELEALAWRCEVCPGSTLCPTGEPVVTRSLCTGPSEQLEAVVVAYRCGVDCAEQLGPMCPPYDLEGQWVADYNACVNECRGL